MMMDRYKSILICLHSFIFLTVVCFAQTSYFADTLTLGDHKRKVIEVLGEPDKKSYGPSYEVWFYDDEYLHFYEHLLMSYSSAAALSIDVKPRRFRQVEFLDLSSTPDDILSLLGTPSKVDQGYLRDIWFYGHEEIHLKNDVIIYFSDRDKLKFKFKTQKLKTDPMYLKSLTINDLITILGTPTRLRRGLRYDVWWYGTNFILTMGDNVYFVNKKPNSVRDAEPLTKSNPEFNEISRKLKHFMRHRVPAKQTEYPLGYDDL